MDKSEAVNEAATSLYNHLLQAGVDVLLDDRGERPGVMFAEMELIGIPHRIVIGDRGLKEGMVEYQARKSKDAQSIHLDRIVEFLKNELS
jgi:prolyl-tRNA synthetase